MQSIGDSVWVHDTEVTLAQYMQFVLESPLPRSTTFPVQNSVANDLFSEGAKYETIDVEGESDWYKCKIVSGSPSKKLLNFIFNCPVTGITYQQAMAYCQWRTRQDSIFALENNLPFRYVYGLISPHFYDEINPSNDSLNNQGTAQFNYKGATFTRKWWVRYRNLKLRCGKATLPRGQFNDNSLGLYDVQGNVAEITSVEGIAKGGSYEHPARDSYKGIVISYSTTEPWLGFRTMARRVRR